MDPVSLADTVNHLPDTDKWLHKLWPAITKEHFVCEGVHERALACMRVFVCMRVSLCAYMSVHAFMFVYVCTRAFCFS